MLRPQYINTLPVFHTMTGCDITVTQFGIGKNTAWSAWKSFPQVTETFVTILQDPACLKLDYQHMQHLERWVVFMYCKNNWSKETSGLKDLVSIPPTQHAFFQYAKRELFCAAFIWKQALFRTPEIPSPGDWDWTWNARTRESAPHWTDLPDVSQESCCIVGVQLPVAATASAIELVFAAVFCLNVKEAAKIAPHRNLSDDDGVFCCLGLTVTYD